MKQVVVRCCDVARIFTPGIKLHTHSHILVFFVVLVFVFSEIRVPELSLQSTVREAQRQWSKDSLLV